jgi:hypothetical protein
MPCFICDVNKSRAACYVQYEEILASLSAWLWQECDPFSLAPSGDWVNFHFFQRNLHDVFIITLNEFNGKWYVLRQLGYLASPFQYVMWRVARSDYGLGRLR